MKKIHRVLAMLMAAIMALSLITTAFAEPTIDPAKNASLSIYKYDITTASAEGAWDTESYVSTGLHDDAVIDKLSKYAIQGVEFTYLRVADISMNNELVESQRQVGVLYGFDSSDRSTTVLSAIGLTGADAHKTENGVNYFTSDMLNNKLSAALTANATTVKNALEAAVKNGGVAMPETDATGHASADQLEQGLYLVVETRVPENVTSTCNPFFVSLPMTTVDGAAWNYDVTVYPKNQTGNPTLDKTVREATNSTGKNTGSLTDITDGYAHTASASIGDTVDYQIISTLPTITSKASALSEYTYVDTHCPTFLMNFAHWTTIHFWRTNMKLKKPNTIVRAVCAGAGLTLCCLVPVYATGGDPLTIVNNLSDFIFSVIKAIGIIILGWGIVQVGMSIQSHDASQRTQGLLCLFGGLLIAFAKEILTLIGAV